MTVRDDEEQLLTLKHGREELWADFNFKTRLQFKGPRDSYRTKAEKFCKRFSYFLTHRNPETVI